MEKSITLWVNGQRFTLEVEPHHLLLDVLRERVGLTGARRGCETGNCGSCTILLDGKAVRSCLQLAVRARDRAIQTIEGLSEGEKLHPLQRAFMEKGALECGYCTSGMILLAKGLLDENPTPTEEEVRRVLASNLCRCTGYQKMIQAILAVASDTQAQRTR
ncbi:MAG: (2Fe-2S)-binding protein [Candidatus Rokubacteria bacterium]|nr:(2Fe-2S)-binding protein [Candidatus Rokubacteria bacterium]